MNGEYNDSLSRFHLERKLRKKTRCKVTERKTTLKNPWRNLSHSLDFVVYLRVRRNFSTICFVDTISTLYLPSVSKVPKNKTHQTIGMSLAAKPFNLFNFQTQVEKNQTHTQEIPSSSPEPNCRKCCSPAGSIACKYETYF